KVLAQIHNVSDCHKSKTGQNFNKVNKKLQQFTSQRTIPMTGKKVWPVESCARTSEWFLKNHRPISEGKRLLKVAFEDSSDESSVKAVGYSAVTGNLRQLDLHTSLTEITKEITHKKMGPNIDCQTSLETPESSSVDIYETLTVNNGNRESPVNTDRSAMAFNHGDVQEANTTWNLTAKQKAENEDDINEGDMTNRNLPATVQNGTSAGNTNRINFSPKVSVVNQTFSDLKLIKPLTSGNLTKFKIPLYRNKAESKKLESVHSLERKTCGPPELLESSSPGRLKTSEETFLVKSEQHPRPVMSDATSPASIQKKADEIDSKDFQHDGSVHFSNEMSVLPESFSSYPHPLLNGQSESSVTNFCGTECVLKSSFPDGSWDAVDHLVGLDKKGDRKSKGNFSQHKSHNLPDILEAYNQDVLVIDVIQDDPDLFGTSNEEELARARCENCPVKVSSANCIKDTKEDIKLESPVTSEKTYSVENSFRYAYHSFLIIIFLTEDVKTHNSSRGSSPSGDVSENFLKDRQQNKLDELLKSLDMDEKFKLADGVPVVEEENKSKAEKRYVYCILHVTCGVPHDCKYKVNCELLSGLPLNDQKVNLFSEATEMKSWTNGYKSSERSTSLPLKNCGDSEPWKMEKNAVQILDALNLPRKYCRYYFMTSRGCERTKCWFCHVPGQGDEKICMAILRTYISIKESGLLKRAVQIFVQYYQEVTPGVDFASEVLNDLLVSLLNNCLLQEAFQILNVIVQIKTLPDVDVLLKVFEHVASLNIRNAVPTLISIFCKLIEAGMFLELEHFDYIIKLLHQLQVSTWEMSIVLNIKSRYVHISNSNIFSRSRFGYIYPLLSLQHCKEKRDWTKLGALYLSARTGCEHFDDLQKLFLSIAEILSKDSETDRPGVPFCDFADAVMKNPHHNNADKLFIGRTGISVMYSYHKVLQWIKGRKVLDKLHELQIHFTLLKGLVGAGRSASRCQIVNKAAEIFLHSGNLDGATRILRESEWVTDAPLGPCDKMDILNRHNLLYAIVHKYLRKSLYRQAFEVLQNLPGLQKHSGIVDASQYSCLFNKLINACFENKNLGVSSSAVDFMLSKKIAIDFFLLRRLITALGRSSLWSKARTYYKNALSLGCYPELQGNLYHKLLKIPSYLSEVEMLVTLEIFLVSNASDIQSARTTSQTLQIILKRSEDAVQNNSAYHEAVERLIQAARLSDPKLSLKHMTINVNMEEVYSVEHSSALKWLQENMKWAEKVWLFQ
ncbi:TOPZ1 protein, partial [Chaetops frenatus]|nr:TOPZ1 protein [Chaetops frenatus]